VIAGSARGLVVVTDPDAVANAVADAARLQQQGKTSPGDRARLAPSGLWDAVGLWPFLVDGDVPLDVPGLGPVRTFYVLDAAHRAVVVPRAAFDTAISGLDTRTRTVLEHELVRGLLGGNPEAGWRPVEPDADLPAARTRVSDPPALPTLEYVATLGRKYGRATAVMAGRRDTGPGWLVVHPRGGDDVDRALDTAAAYRVLGVPAQHSWPAVVAEVVNPDGSPNGDLRSGERVEVAHYRGGREVDLDEPDQRAQVARLLVAGQLLGDVDLRAAKKPNLIRNRRGIVGLVDFDGGLERDLDPAEDHFQFVLRGAPFDTRDAQKIFGVLTEADLLAGYRYVAERGAEVLAVIGDPVRQVMTGARLDWVRQVVAAGRLPDWLYRQLEEAQRVAAVAHPGERLPHHPYPLEFTPGQVEMITSALARMRQEQPVERPDGSVGNRDPPGEALFVFPADGLAAELRAGVSESTAADLVERLVAIAWHEDTGPVVGISEERFGELDRLGALGPVLDGARSRAPPVDPLERLRTTAAGDPEFWGRAGRVLELIDRDGVGEGGERSAALRRVAETLLAGSLRGGRELADGYLPWVARRLGSPSWLAKWWPTASLPARVALGVLVALVGDPAWLRGLSKKRRDPRDLTRLVRLWTDGDLAEHLDALADVLRAASAAARIPESERSGSWLSLVHAVVAVSSHSDPGRSARVLDTLRDLPAAISAAGPSGNAVALLSDATAVVQAIGTGASPRPAMQIWMPAAPGASATMSGIVTLYHGTTDRGADSIRNRGVDLSVQRDRTDFGTGFYATPDDWDARRMARKRAQSHGGSPVVLRFDVPAEALNRMSGIWFPHANIEYQEFVRMMRLKGRRHSYDWVRGPVLYSVRDFLAGGEVNTSGDQISFHTPQAAELLDTHLVEERAVRRAGRNGFDCACGENHWGRHGAAGLLLWHRDAAGVDRFLLQQRGRSDHPGTWGLLGGAREQDESAERAAIREAVEESGIDPAAFTVLGSFLDDHGGWSYTTVFAVADSRNIDFRLNRETRRLEWVRRDQVHMLNLHPGLAATWSDVLKEFLGREG
jgi:8-oxo-dGTP pyrophosphatase MutT (NUDIX family)